ncbi:hypothetical protein [uncultured Selenomonas sp.]|uniref:hypothetical protein n=1 Tax=uncultured Selenomonas sp. TaxID=159275 RepID=UPI002674F531|nr:hypothetical protein [uncultured Selenomonas sp.]
MTAKEYLSQAYRIDQRVNSKLRQVDSLRDLATRATSTMGTEPVSGTRNVHRLADTIDKIVDLENEINDDIDHLVDLKREVMATISKVQDTNALMLLELRYLSFMSWDEIAGEMHYTSRWVHILHSKALTAVDKILAAEVDRS